MALAMPLASLRSRKVDAKLQASRTAGKVLKAAGKTGILARLARFGGWAIGSIFSFFNIDFEEIWDLFVDAYFEIKEFDWNATDQELEAQIAQNNNQILSEGARVLGEQLGIGAVRITNFFIGKFLGARGRGAAAAQGMKVPVLSKRVALALADEQNSELRAGMENFLRSAGAAMTSNAMINFVLTARRAELFGFKPITKEIDADGSIAARIEEKIEQLPKDWQRPVESFLEGIEDGIINAGYVIADEADDHVAIGRYLMGERTEGEEVQTLEVWPNGDEDESQPMVFVGRRDEIQEAAKTMLPAYPLLDEAGGDIGMPMSWALKPGAERPQLAVIYRAKGKTGNHTLHIPHYAGGRSPSLPSYYKGDILGYWVLADGSKLQVYGSSERECRKMLKAMSRDIPAKFKLGKPIVKPSGQKVQRALMTPISATFYEKGTAGPSTWKAYLKGA